MPHLNKLQTQHADRGFVIIASHVQAPGRDEVVDFCRANGVNFTITSQGRPQGDESKGIPQAYLFDWTGKCVEQGHPGGMDKQIDALMQAAPHWLTGGRELESKAVRGFTRKLFKAKSYGKLLEELDQLARKEEDAADANYLKERILAYGQRELDAARAEEQGDAFRCQAGYEWVAKAFEQTPPGESAAARLKELKADDAFQQELKAAKLAAKAESLAGELTLVGGTMRPQHPQNAPRLQAIAKLLRLLKQDHPDSRAYARVQDLLKRYGL